MVPVLDNGFVITGETGVLDIGVFLASDHLDEVGHVQDTTHPTRVISKEDATESCKGNDEVGPEGDGGLDTVDIGRAGDGDGSSTRHDCKCSTASKVDGRGVSKV